MQWLYGEETGLHLFVEKCCVSPASAGVGVLQSKLPGLETINFNDKATLTALK
jgi:hypothetical protein